MNQMMNELGELLGQQQQLLDDTFRQQQGSRDSKANRDSKASRVNRASKASRAAGSAGSTRPAWPAAANVASSRARASRVNRARVRAKARVASKAKGRAKGKALAGLAERQQAPARPARQLQRGMNGMGMQTPEQFGEAGERWRRPSARCATAT